MLRAFCLASTVENLEDYCAAFVSCVVLQAVQRYVLVEIKQRLTSISNDTVTDKSKLDFEDLFQPLPESDWIPNDQINHWSETSIKTMHACLDIQLIIESCQRALVSIHKSLLSGNREDMLQNNSQAFSVALKSKPQVFQHDDGFVQFWDKLNELTPDYLRTLSLNNQSLMPTADGKRRKMSSSRRVNAREYIGSLFISCLRRRPRMESRKDVKSF
ncbi:uncharacterized protein LOC106875670 isoform X1 [Octopus bimaculoides]|uniref:uncharacterized protein LOC106875670 isoform X1 n=1 Tax=Octopus bimaculoides TaxID=37653 RepID=UPI00071D635F|nr:uncharacterized protein LOC106875670 isoform X1 [Octopus bimaculoides]|eukprot:XP_014779395.1 PREDICTED: uncharacterized protein LOC106875670 isoform X1 [Octopus bimaculoides]